MRNPKRGSIYEVAVMGMAGLVIASVALEWTEFSRELKALTGALYGIVAYFVWLGFVTHYGSSIYDENDEPVQIDIVPATISFILAIPGAVILGGLFLWFLYDDVRLAWKHAKRQ